MAKANSKIMVQETEITFINKDIGEYILLTDIAKYRKPLEPFSIINNWMRSRSTIEFLGLWEKLNNSNFKPIEFERFKSEAGSNYFILSPQRWIDKGNIGDNATLEQLVVLSNMESINALLIQQGLTQSERLIQLNRIAITQMKSLIESKAMKKLK